MPEASEYKAPRWAWWVATGFGSGRLKPGPGTWGSLVAAIAWFGLVLPSSLLPPVVFECLIAGLTLAMIVVSIFVTGLVIRQIQTKDPRCIVSDEWAGMWLALWPTRHYVSEAIYGGGLKMAVALIFAAFLFFRLFDILKPWPIRKLESLPGPWGVTMDDVMAGIFAALLVYGGMAMLLP